jgi:hypothetical protein
MLNCYCYYFTGGWATPEARDMIFLAATEMLRRNKEKELVKGETFEAIVTTKFTPGLLGTVSGFIFTAEGEGDYGKIEAKFLVQPNHLRDREEMEQEGVWVSGKDIPSTSSHLN